MNKSLSGQGRGQGDPRQWQKENPGNSGKFSVWPHEEEEAGKKLGNSNQVCCRQAVNCIFICPLNSELECTFT